MRIKTLIITSILLLTACITEAQSIRVLPPSTANIGSESSSILYNRLNQLVTLNGIGSTDNSNKFLLIPSVTVTSIESTTTAPVQYVAEVEITMFIVDNSRRLLMSQETIVKKGVGDTESKAIQEAIKSIKSRDPKLKKMIVTGKDKIIEYYNLECETVVRTINTYLEMGMYEEAINELNAIPQIDENTGCYDNSLNIMSKISKAQQDDANNSIMNSIPDISWINK